MRRPVRTVLTVGLLTWATAAATLVGAAPAPAAVLEYVALGDSYAAGPGAGDYAAPAAPCYRSANAYPELWAAARAVEFVNDTCSGATVPTVRSSQGGHLDAGTDRVTLTIGGNDVGFGSIVAACRLYVGNCTTANTDARAKIADLLPGRLADLFAWLRGRAPAAHVVVTGYPVPYNATALCLGGVARSDRAAVNETIRRLNAAISDAVVARVAAGGDDLVFAPVTAAFEGHRLCDTGTRYINDLGSSDVVSGVYHPTAAGHRYGYLPAVSSS